MGDSRGIGRRAGAGLTAVLLPALLAGAAVAQHTERAPAGPEELAALAEAAAPYLVRVQYTLQYAEGQAPEAALWGEVCPNCGSVHSYSGENFILQERPYEVAGFLLSPGQVITPDLCLHPRFVRRIAVRAGDRQYEVRPAAYAVDRSAWLLDLEEPIAGAVPLSFSPQAKAPHYHVSPAEHHGVWCTDVQPWHGTVRRPENGAPFIELAGPGLVVDATGNPVGVAVGDTLPLDGSWRGDPSVWPMVPAQRHAELLAALQARNARRIVRVGIDFRSPKAEAGDSYSYYSRYSDEDDEDTTRRDVCGIVLDATRVLVLAGLEPPLTARLEQITIYAPDTEPIPAQFLCSMKDYGFLLASASRPLAEAVALSEREIVAYRDAFLLESEVQVYGDSLTAYYGHTRLRRFELAWEGRPFPELTRSGENTVTLVFDTEGALVAVPLERRKHAFQERGWHYGEQTLVPARYLAEMLKNLAEHTDPCNIPLTSTRESRLAWIGVELQPLDRELARASGVSHLSKDGESGALVSYVYPDSPASRAGIQVGDVLLRIHSDGEPVPLEVRIRDDWRQNMEFSWKDLDQMPPEYFDELPPPWPSAASGLRRALSYVAFGSTCSAELFRAGSVQRVTFETAEMPTHYEAAAQLKSEALGMTVRDLTFEVRRYFQREADEPGVIVARIEAGGRAAVAGIRPYEIVTHANDQAIHHVADLEAVAAQAAELRFAVKRMNEGRVVRIVLPTP